MTNPKYDDTQELKKIITNHFDKIKNTDANLIRIKLGHIVSKHIIKDGIDRNYIHYIIKILNDKPTDPIFNNYKYFWQNKILIVNMDGKTKWDNVYQYKLISFELFDRFQIHKDMDIGVSILNKTYVNSMEFSCLQKYSLLERVVTIPFIINDNTILNVNVYPDYITINIDINHPHTLIDRIYQQIKNDVIELINKMNNIFT